MVPLAFLANLSAASLREALAEFETGATSPVACAADQKIGRSKEVSRFQILPGLCSNTPRHWTMPTPKRPGPSQRAFCKSAAKHSDELPGEIGIILNFT